MADTEWPDAKATYVDDANDQPRWQQAIDSALNVGTLHWSPTPTSTIFDLVGQCPRCGHDTSQPVYFKYIVGVLPATPEPATTNVVCDCDEDHEDRPDGKTGCGWALLPFVKLAWPLPEQEEK